MGIALLPRSAFASFSIARPRILVVNNLNTGQSIKAKFFDGKGCNKEELVRLNYLFRDYRSHKIKSINPCLFEHLYRLQELRGTSKPVQLISGYHSLDTNKANCVRTAVARLGTVIIPKGRRWISILKASN